MSKIAEEIYRDAEYQQEKNLDCMINVGYGFRRNKHNLLDVKKIAESRMRRYAISLKYNVITKEEYEHLIKVNEQLIKSIDYTIKDLYELKVD